MSKMKLTEKEMDILLKAIEAAQMAKMVKTERIKAMRGGDIDPEIAMQAIQAGVQVLPMALSGVKAVGKGVYGVGKGVVGGVKGVYRKIRGSPAVQTPTPLRRRSLPPRRSPSLPPPPRRPPAPRGRRPPPPQYYGPPQQVAYQQPYYDPAPQQGQMVMVRRRRGGGRGIDGGQYPYTEMIG